MPELCWNQEEFSRFPENVQIFYVCDATGKIASWVKFLLNESPGEEDRPSLTWAAEGNMAQMETHANPDS